jgi:Domain of unknown function (DUF4436)
MKHFGRWARVAVVLAMVAVYLFVVWMGLTEESRRSLILAKSSATTGDYVIVNVKVTGIDAPQGLLHERIRLIPMGRFAADRATPAVDLKLLINSVSGKQTVEYPKGERISPVDFTSVLSGNLNRYPFDRYISDIDLLVTAAVPPAPPPPRAPRRPPAAPAAPAPSASPAPSGSPSSSSGPPASSGSTAPSAPGTAPAPEEAASTEDANPIETGLVVGTSDLNKSESVPINENFVASIPGVRFEGQVSQDDTYKLMRTSVVMRRARNVVTVSIVVMSVMFILAISVMVMALRVAASPSEINLLPLSLCVTLIFGLPALRNTQPGVPGIGALCDYLSFIWAEFIVTTSAIALAWTWVIRTIRDQRPKAR